MERMLAGDQGKSGPGLKPASSSLPPWLQSSWLTCADTAASTGSVHTLALQRAYVPFASLSLEVGLGDPQEGQTRRRESHMLCVQLGAIWIGNSRVPKGPTVSN